MTVAHHRNLSPRFTDRNGAQRRSLGAERFATRLRKRSEVKEGEMPESGFSRRQSARFGSERHSPASRT